MPAFDYDALYNKSRLYIERGIRSRSEGDFEQFQLWAALSLELLGKAALAQIHPALIADPESIHSLFAACGWPIGPNIKSVGARTVFDRLTHISKAFDQNAQRFCALMADRRNAELHSGEVPYAGMRPEAWVARFWQVSKVILDAQAKSLTEWVGADEAADAEEIINRTITALQQAIRARINQCRSQFDATYPPGSPEREAIEGEMFRLGGVLAALFDQYEGDALEPCICPACSCEAAVSGEYWDEVVTNAGDPSEPWLELVNTTYTTLAFRCRACGLRLNGREELDLAGLLQEFVHEEVREPDYEPDYGND